ncbi:MAG TPA: DUF885 domain-containing protein [Planctomycetota bacterium]|nr:DUF885 domain-containing protein [Planctomycetota bacterium]
MSRSILLAFLALVAGCGLFEPDPETWGMPEDQRGRGENGKFATLVDAYLSWHYAAHPVSATYDGIHAYDDRLQDLSANGIAAEAAAQRRWLDRLRAIDPELLSADAAVDHEVLASAMQAALVDLEDVRSWERDPGFYVGHISDALYALAALQFAPPERRMSLATQRLTHVKSVLDAARANLKTPPALLTELAIEDADGAKTFISESLPAALDQVKDESLRKPFDRLRQEAAKSLESFGKWLKEDLLPRSTAPVALGEELFRRKLAAEEMVDTPTEALLAEGEALLKLTVQRMEEVAEKLQASKLPMAEVLRAASVEHPAANELLDSVRALLEDLKRASREKLYDVPADADCKVQETPSFRRETSFASMEIPGPFEAVARDAYYSVTLPEASWDAARTAQHLRFFNRYSLKLISVHEAYPGHYTQFLTLRGLPSKVRRVFGCGAFSEGWAHYLEEAYVDEVEPDDPKLRLFQLNLALLRICRYVVAIRMHCRGMSVEEAAKFFVEEGLQEKANAEREARRGAADPMYLIYTLGKMQILHLREECREAWGDAFSLKAFHHRLLATGYPPVKLARRLMLGAK